MTPDAAAHGLSPGQAAGWLLLLAAPFYLNDFASIFIRDWRVWLAIDYLAVKLFTLALIVWLVRTRRMQASDLGLRRQPVAGLVLTFGALVVVGTLIDQNADTFMTGWAGYRSLGSMPEIASPAWNGFDLTAGLMLVALTEELVFRAAMASVLTRFGAGKALTVLLSALFFGLIHWSLGLHTVLATGTIGAVFMVAYQRTKALPAPVLAHFAIDFIAFADIVPKAVFRLA